MPTFANQGLSLHYETHGHGVPVLFLHGAAVSFEYNFAKHGWIECAVHHGLQVIGLDFRGHGKSDKPHGAASYGAANLASDALALLDHLGIQSAALVGYSLGTTVAVHLLRHSPNRCGNVALIATGDGLLGHPPYALDGGIPALEAVFSRDEYPGDLPPHLAAYWNFVQAAGGSLRAMSALARAKYPSLTEGEAAAIEARVLVISGEKDNVLGRGMRLASAFPRGKYIEIPGADHFSLSADSDVQTTVSSFVSNAGRSE